jgi:hypothetical protein
MIRTGTSTGFQESREHSGALALLPLRQQDRRDTGQPHHCPAPVTWRGPAANTERRPHQARVPQRSRATPGTGRGGTPPRDNDRVPTLSYGEWLMARYLDQRGWSWEYERPVGERNPDFFVHHLDRDFGVEVYEPDLKLDRLDPWFDSYGPLRRMFAGRKRKQLAAARAADLPFVIALAHTRSDVPFRPEIVAGAMFGNLQMTFPVGPDVEPNAAPTSEMSFGHSAKVQPQRFRGLSAVVLLDEYNPTALRVDQALAARLGVAYDYPGRSRDSVTRDVFARQRAIDETYEHFTLTGEYIGGVRRTRLTALHNPFATHALGLDVFNGPQDMQWDRCEVEGVLGYGPVAGRSLPQL